MKSRMQKGVISISDLLIIGAGAVLAAILLSFFTERGTDALYPTDTGEKRLFDGQLDTSIELTAKEKESLHEQIEEIPEQKGSCGIVVETPEKRAKIDEWNIRIRGEVNGCKWRIVDGLVGTVQLFDAKGNPLSQARELTVFDNGNFQTQLIMQNKSQSLFGAFYFINNDIEGFPREKRSIPVRFSASLR